MSPARLQSRPPGRHRLAPSGHRRWRPSLAATVTATLLAIGLLPAGAGAANAASPAHPIMFGAVGNTRTNVLAHEKVLGRTLRGLRVYQSWDQQLFGPSQTWARDTGHTLFLSIDSHRKNGSSARWADIANAGPGSSLYREMVSQANQIKAFKARVYIAYNHEPDAGSSASLGSPAQFVAAWRKLITVYRNAGVTNAKYAWVMTAYSFRRSDGKRAQVYYPGDSYVDDIAADGYNWYHCRDSGAGWASMSTIFDGQRRFGLQHPSKGLMIWEFSSAEDRNSPGRKAAWFHDAENLFQTPAWSQYEALLTWEGRSVKNNLNCNFDYLSSPSATAAWKQFGRDPAYIASQIS